MAQNARWKYQYKRTGLIRNQARTTLEKHTLQAAKAARDKAQSKVTTRTGALAASIYATSAKEDDYSQAVSDSRNRNPAQSSSQELPPLPTPPQTRTLASAAVDCALSYGVAVENGALNPSTGAFSGARPFFAPSVQETFPDFISDLEKALRTL